MVDHVYDPFTGEHRPECVLADMLYNQIVDNLMLAMLTQTPLITSDQYEKAK